MRLTLPGWNVSLWRTGLQVMLVLLPLSALAEPVLNSMDKQESPYQTRISLSMSELPQFTVDPSGQRIDLELKGTVTGEALRKLPEDETVVKIIVAKKSDSLLLSILLRQPPTQILTESESDPARINIDIYWQDSDAARPAVAFRIAGMPPRKAGRGASAYQKQSAWEDNWKRFFADYRQDWKLQLPFQYSLPELPPLINSEDSPLMSLQRFADDGRFLSLQHHADQLVNLTEEQRFQRDVLVAEAQLRSNATAAGLARLETVRNQSDRKTARVEYLTAYGQAQEGQPIVGQLTLAQMLPAISDDDTYLPLYHLLYAETDLDAKRNKDAVAYLDNDTVTWPQELTDLVALRRADALAGAGQLKQATAAYKNLATIPELLEHHLFSFNRAAYAAFQSHDYQFAADLYKRLADISEGLEEDVEGYDLILFASGAAAYESGNLVWGKIGLEKAMLDDPATEGSQRAKLRLIDLQVIPGGELELATAVMEYGALAKSSTYRTVREESAFKQALGHYLLGDHRQSVDELMIFQRDYSSSALRHDAEVLLAEQIPLVVHQLLLDKNDLEAVVLVEKNRKLLLSRGFNRQFLEDLASAFSRLGLYERSARVLLYLLDRIQSPDERAHIYLPLATSYLKRREYAKVSEYARRYLEDYPHGEDAGALFGLLLDAFEKQHEDDKILAWLAQKNRPSSPALEVRAAWLYWRLGQQERLIESLNQAREEGADLQVKEMALLAEANYQQDNLTAARIAYAPILKDKEYGPQAQYRTAQILIKHKEIASAASLLNGLIKDHAESHWAKLAQDLLIDIKR